MTGVLEQALDLGNLVLSVWGLVFLRVGAMMALLPVFGERTIPVRVRLVLTLALTALVAPALAADPGALDRRAFVSAALPEVAVGLALGIALRLLILALQTAGTIAANVTSLSQILGAVSVDPQPAIAHLLLLAGLALAVTAGLHVEVVAALIRSYALFPIGTWPATGDLTQWGVAQVAGAFALAFGLAAPFVITSLVYNAALGAINRAMPQLMVAFVGAPAITLGALALLALIAPDMLRVWHAAFDRALSGPGAF